MLPGSQSIPPLMGCLLSHPEIYPEPQRQPGYELHYRIQIPPQAQAPAEYQEVRLQDLWPGETLQARGPQILMPQQAFLPERDLAQNQDRDREQRPRELTHICDRCTDVTRYRMRPNNCPYTGKPLISDVELEIRYNNLVFERQKQRELERHNRELLEYPVTAVIARDSAYRREGVGMDGVQREQESEDGMEDVIEGGFERKDFRYLLPRMTKIRVTDWIEDCRGFGSVGFDGGFGASGSGEGSMYVENTEGERRRSRYRYEHGNGDGYVGDWGIENGGEGVGAGYVHPKMRSRHEHADVGDPHDEIEREMENWGHQYANVEEGGGERWIKSRL